MCIGPTVYLMENTKSNFVGVVLYKCRIYYYYFNERRVIKQTVTPRKHESAHQSVDSHKADVDIAC